LPCHIFAAELTGIHQLLQTDLESSTAMASTLRYQQNRGHCRHTCRVLRRKTTEGKKGLHSELVIGVLVQAISAAKRFCAGNYCERLKMVIAFVLFAAPFGKEVSQACTFNLRLAIKLF
jgi:hypothetical protein